MAEETLGRAMRAVRQGAGRAVVDVARDLGRSRSAVYLWERDRTLPDPREIRRWVELCGAGEWQVLRLLDLRSRAQDTSA